MTRSNRAIAPWILAAVLAVGLAGCNSGIGGDKAADKDGEEENPPIPVEVASVSRGEVRAVYSGTASLESDGEARVLAKVSGEIVELLVEEGDRVAAGQVLARLDGDQLRLEVERARANLKRLEQDYRRNVELHAKGLVSTGAFENQKFEVDAIKADLALSQLQLDYTNVRATIAGVVSERHVKPGNSVSVNQALFTITDMEPLLAYLHVPERDFNKIKEGQAADVRVDAQPDQAFSGSIARISPVIDPASGTFKVTVEINDSASRLKPGMFGRISIVYDVRQDSVLIPRAAIVDEQTSKSVFVVTNGTVERRAIETGYAAGSNVEIVSGLSGSEQVVVIGQSGLKDGGKVEVVNRDEAPGLPDDDDNDRAELAAKISNAG